MPLNEIEEVNWSWEDALGLWEQAKKKKEVGGCLRSLRIAKEIKIYLIL